MRLLYLKLKTVLLLICSRFEKSWNSFEEAARYCGNYNSEILLKRAKKVTEDYREKVRYGFVDEFTARLVMSFYSLGLLEKNKIRVLDFGGSFGVHYFGLSPILTKAKLDWSICELPVLVNFTLGDDLLKDLQYFSDFEASLSNGPYDLTVCSGVIQCLPDPMNRLLLILKGNRVPLYLDRLFLSESTVHKVVRFSIKSDNSRVSIPMWIFSKHLFEKQVQDMGWKIHFHWEGSEHHSLGGDLLRSRGYLLKPTI